MHELDPAVGVQGSREFAAERRDLIRAYQSAREKDVNRPIHTEPGEVAEGVFRAWLEGFLPARYGVTSGYIISPRLPADAPARHFDVIIYDRLEAPVLWCENNLDKSSQGLHRPIPVEHVLAVLEVKATLTKDSAEKAIAKLHELDLLMSGEDDDDEYYPIYLPKRFVCGVVFFRVDGKTSGHVMDPFVRPGLRGFIGGVVLSITEDELGDSCAWLPPVYGAESQYRGDKPFASRDVAARPKQEHGGGFQTIVALFSPSSFALFAFDLLHRISPKYRPGFVATAHGMGFMLRRIPDPGSSTGTGTS